MTHSISETAMSTSERDFRDLLKRGDDFFNIELFRPSKVWYQRALAFNMDTEKVKQRIAECDRLLVYEMKIFKILGVVVVGLVLAWFLFSRI